MASQEDEELPLFTEEYELNQSEGSVSESFEWGSEIKTENVSKTHRVKPERGPLDKKTDSFLDSRSLSVNVVKWGNRDGSYLFGQRIMKVQELGGALMVIQGKKKLKIEDFTMNFDSTEYKRQQALFSAIQIFTMLNGKGTPKFIKI